MRESHRRIGVGHRRWSARRWSWLAPLVGLITISLTGLCTALSLTLTSTNRMLRT